VALVEVEHPAAQVGPIEGEHDCVGWIDNENVSWSIRTQLQIVQLAAFGGSGLYCCQAHAIKTSAILARAPGCVE
jgi:hypothetical protein